MVAEIHTSEDDERKAMMTAQLPKISALSVQREDQRKWCCDVWDLRRQAVGAVSSRLLTDALRAH